MSLTRRNFIKISATALGAGAAGAGIAIGTHTSSKHVGPGTDGDRVVPTFCDLCFWKCGVNAHVKGGVVTKLEGNPEHPLSSGRLCPRGTGGTGLLYDPDRLKWPLMRKGGKAGQEFERVSWETALSHTAEKLMKLKDRYGPEALAMYAHGLGGSWFKTLGLAYGTAAEAGPSYAQCRGSRETAFELTFGAPVGSPENTDIEHARCMTLIGSHLGENMHNTQVQWLARMIDRGGELIVVDPRFSTAAGKAKYWLPIKPGTDIALLLAWMHVIIEEKLYDAAYIDQYSVGLDELKQHVKDKTPQWAAVRTGIDAEQIVATARLMAGSKPASFIHPGRHTAWYGDDSQRGRAIAIINALLGSWGRKGGFYMPAKMPLPAYPTPKNNHTPRTPPDMPKGVVYPFASHGLAHGLRDASIPGTADYDIKAWLVYSTNLIQALPNVERTKEALAHLDFTLVIDVLPTEITGWADVLLPEATYLERHDDLHVCAFKEPFIALRQPVVEPAFETKPGWWIARELGKKMGYAEYFPWNDVDEYIDTRLHAGGYDVAAIRQKGVIKSQPEPIYFEEGLQASFATPSGKIELYSEQMKEAGLAPLPEYTEHEQPAPGQFRLLFGRAPMHTFGRTTNNRFLGQQMDENVLWLNENSAEELGLKGGDWVHMENQDGALSAAIRVRATQRIRRDCVYMVHGFGHTDKRLRFAKGRGADDAVLCTRTKVDPAMGGTGMNVNFVRIKKGMPAS